MSGKVAVPLIEMARNWTSIELEMAVSVRYIIKEVYVQHHFPQRSEDRFKRYIDVFFDIKKKAAEEGNGF